MQDLGAAGVRVLADPGKIHQVIMNLAANAGYAMRAAGGTLKISLRQVRLSGAALRPYPSLKAGRYLKLSVSDTGVGMDSTTLDRVFEPFFTTKPKGEGTGLGLSVVHGIISSLNGAVAVRSAPDKGTNFDIVLPVESGARTAPHPKASESKGSGERVMVVDDEEAVLRMMIMMLLDLGYRPTGFSDPKEAWRKFEENPEEWDLAILDQTMPGMTGLEMVEKMLALAPNFGIILVTGYSDVVDGDLAREAGASDFAHKPLLRQELGEMAKRCLVKHNG
jgi:CheY-like chemotaxis protein